jgi:hypothetical protein
MDVDGIREDDIATDAIAARVGAMDVSAKTERSGVLTRT